MTMRTSLGNKYIRFQEEHEDTLEQRVTAIGCGLLLGSLPIVYNIVHGFGGYEPNSVGGGISSTFTGSFLALIGGMLGTVIAGVGLEPYTPGRRTVIGYFLGTNGEKKYLNYRRW